MLQIPSKSTLYALLSLSLSGCLFSSTHYEVRGDSSTLEGLTKVHAIKTRTKTETSNQLRLSSVRDYGFSISAQTACAHHTQQLEQLLNQLDSLLDRVYSFNAWMLPNNVLPPVLIKAENAVNQIDNHSMRIAGRIYRIEKDAKFVTQPPHWRYDYLLKDTRYLNDTNKKLAAELLPKNVQEQAIWKDAVQEGWKAGIEQARNNFMLNLNTLARDLHGMVIYRQLLAKGMVTAPYIAHTDLGVTGDKHTLTIHDQLLRITELPILQHQTDKWQPIIKQARAT